MVIFWDGGRKPRSSDICIIVVMIGARISRQSLTIHVGAGSRSHWTDGRESSSLVTSSIVTGVNEESSGVIRGDTSGGRASAVAARIDSTLSLKKSANCVAEWTSVLDCGRFRKALVVVRVGC